ncbi:hypothetical protein JXD20_00775 [Candidatus Peregrinibacteria bacterium]|nr:hypothetical protein [Candidatus Peregrinibacteria bacterium]
MQAPQPNPDSNTDNEPPPSGPGPLDLRALMEDAGFVTEENIQELRTRMLPDYQRAFDFASKNDQLIYVALARRSAQELIAIRGRNGNRMSFGMHRCRSHIDFILEALPEFSAVNASQEKK